MEHQDPYDKAQLLLRYLRNEATIGEQQAVEDWLNENEDNRAFLNQLQTEEGLLEETKFFNQIEKEQAWKQLQKAIIPKTRTLWPRIAAAASVLLILSAGGYFLLKPKQQQQQIAQNQTKDIAPGHNQATLTLAGGKRIILTKGLSGLLATQGKTTIHATKNDIAYSNSQNGDQVSYNTLSTAKGEQSPYPLVLADGTKVWLNAESSITFPTAFIQKERIVKITGEAYFEVAHNEQHPFKVQTATQTIQDIGTHFDVNAYADEPVTRTTLMEGSVKVNNIFLKPGEQTDGLHINNVDTEAAIAWKNGVFMFDSENIQVIMRKIARWYDVDIQYQGDVTTEKYNGTISRYENVSQVLSMMRKTNTVHFKVEGRRITVMK